MGREPDHGAGDTTRAHAPAIVDAEISLSFALTVVEGDDVGKTITVDASSPARVNIGTSETCELRLVDRHVSRRHAAVSLSPHGLGVVDLDSTNGTRVNGILARDVIMVGGELLAVGHTTIRVERRAQPDASVKLPNAQGFGRVIGVSPKMRRLYALLARLSRSNVSVIVEGETGTGKELVAESIHEASARASKPFIVFDCTTGTSSLLESLLFGHERGAFTGAVSARSGVFEQADGGTLFIDEIGDLELGLQAKLLRAIQRQEVQRIGSSKWQKVDVRIIAATRRDLEKEIQLGRFRDDLYYRLAVARVELPALRERPGDIALLASRFWVSLGGQPPLPAPILMKLDSYSWPGNVRELYNAVAHEFALGDLANGDALRIAQARLSSAGNAEGGSPTGDVLDAIVEQDLPYARARVAAIQEFDLRFVRHALARHGGNVTKAAAAYGIARRYFYMIRARASEDTK